ncbi:MAG: M23 family metallopeptidase [Proteobacteria bacterium]|nr:M23 family metallopeptidase [Pseudomonadota bacterium]
MNINRGLPRFAGRCWLRVLAIWWLGLAAHLPAAEPQLVVDKLSTGAVLVVENPTAGDLTVTLQATLTNLTASVLLPKTFNVPPDQRVPLVTLQRSDPTRPWSYGYNWKWNYGRFEAKPDPEFLYRFPFPAGQPRRVVQTFHGTFSHHHPESEFAVDWDMPEGSTVCAARAGVVIAIKSDSNEGGADEAVYRNKANYIKIQHSDGTIGLYVHLKRDGVMVKLGQRVAEGDAIGLSGNTGYSSGPHLHFATQRAIDGSSRVAVPIRFRGPGGAAMIPVKGRLNSVP